MKTEQEIREKLEICGAVYLEIKQTDREKIISESISENLALLEKSAEIYAAVGTLLFVLDDDELYKKYDFIKI